MRVDRRMLQAATIAVTLASGGAPGVARAQAPAPLPPAQMPAPKVPQPAASIPDPGLSPAPGTVIAPPPGVVTAPAGPPIHVHQPGPIAGAVHHLGFAIKDRMIGEPWRFDTPPLGWSLQQNFSAQARMANQHRYTLYRSDFYSGTERLTPDGLRRLGRMVARWQLWGGPMLIELDPDRPGLAESRREAVLQLVANNGMLLEPERLVVGGSPYLGERGDVAAPYNAVLLDRAAGAPAAYQLNPYVNADFGN
ncbi:hypothetical protein [Tautonia sociabilis]|uniref:Uncharacterized protein n=1 Tax=Tautonia sociabilis TaxID=2080755 RepID=A0A432MMB8_9BACT|nr:hypothetical protein [Tautonia sociabilis]RUL88584.1 hypothetical protein TsocGM_06585 [Tautonia sociabilis]